MQMLMYIGTKVVNAMPMTRLEYNNFRNWILPADEDGSDRGYLVEYVDGGKPNTEAYAGYVSWSPVESFNKAYRPLTALTFGQALEALKMGSKIARAGWTWYQTFNGGRQSNGHKDDKLRARAVRRVEIKQ
jgi:hypothetical protein